jgi:hypothetical protein
MVVIEAPRAKSELAAEIRRLHPNMDVRVVGDAYAPRLAVQAINDGHLIGMEL